jgi:aminoglycoside phosphotransferase (APT) family kinase protein
MAEPETARQWQQWVHQFEPQSRLLRVWSLAGGVSARVTALEIERSDGSIQRWVVRQHGEADRRHKPQIAADEFRLLSILHSAGIAVPAPYHVDLSCAFFDTPVIVMEYVDGAPQFAPADLENAIRQLAGQLVAIHRLTPAKWDLSFLRDHTSSVTQKLRQRPAQLDDSLQEGRIRDALEAIWMPRLRNTPALLHGDYWIGNVLWKDERIAAVIDWEDAAVGDPLADVANTRLEILWAFGVDAMHRFTRHYQAQTSIDFTDLPYWDLCAALRPASKLAEWAGSAAREKVMREGHRLFVAQAFEQLNAAGYHFSQ